MHFVSRLQGCRQHGRRLLLCRARAALDRRRLLPPGPREDGHGAVQVCETYSCSKKIATEPQNLKRLGRKSYWLKYQFRIVCKAHEVSTEKKYFLREQSTIIMFLIFSFFQGPHCPCGDIRLCRRHGLDAGGGGDGEDGAVPGLAGEGDTVLKTCEKCLNHVFFVLSSRF